uniref:C2H2-type domain-containing protein n=1 Tax=Brugia timori TaxID=42155 RepID=A0A0R3R4T0_9BILA
LLFLIFRRGPPRPHLKPPRCSMPMNVIEKTDNNEGIANVSDCHARSNEQISLNSDIENRQLNEIAEKVVISNFPAEQKIKTHRKRALIARCQECGLLLKHPSKIQAHMRTHTGERPFECALCGMRFATANPLRVHFRREKPFECTWECGRRFVSVSARNEHERIVHAGIKRYRCSINNCHRLFTRRRYLIMHQAKEHKDVTQQADNAIQSVLDMVKQDREETKANTMWSSEIPDNGSIEKIWIEERVLTGEQTEMHCIEHSHGSDIQFHQVEEQYLNIDDQNGNALLECASVTVTKEEENDLLNDESCRQVIIDETDEDVALERNYFVEANEIYYRNGIRLEYGKQEHQQLSDDRQFVNETESSIVSPDICVRAIDRDVYSVCEESTTVLPKYGRVRIIKPVTKIC